MDKVVEAKHNTTDRVSDYLKVEENAELIETYDAMAEDVAHYNSNVLELNAQIIISQFDIKGLTVNQKASIVDVSEYINQFISAPSRRYARKIKDNDLLAVFKLSDRGIALQNLSEIIPTITTIINKAEKLIDTVPAYAASTEITTEIITEANLLKTTASGFLGQAKMKQGQVRVALERIDEVLKDIWEFDFPNMLDSAQHFNKDHPEFSMGLAKLMKIDNFPTSHTSILGYMKDASGNPIIGGTVSNLDLPKRKPVTTDNLGYYEDISFKWGTHRFLYTHPEYKDKTIITTIAQGQKFEQNVVMEKKISA